MRKVILLLSIFCIWLISIASSPVVTGAKVRLQHKKYQETIDVLEQNKANYSNDAELYYYLARAYAGLANWAKAGDNFSLALAKNPDKDLRKEIDKYRDYHWVQFIKEATVLLEQKRYPEAIQKYRIANTINPDRKESHANLGVALLEQAQIFESATPPQPDSAKLYFDQSIESIQAAMKLDPGNDQFIKNLGQAYIAAGKEEEAIQTYESYMDNHPDDISVQKRLVSIYMNHRDFDKAAKFYDAILADTGEEISMADYFNAGTCYYQQYIKLAKSADAAEKAKAKEIIAKSSDCFAKCYKDDPTDCEAGEQLYYIYITEEKWKEVLSTIESMLTNGCQRSYVTLQNLRVAYIKTEQKTKAIEVFKEAESKKPKEGEGTK